MDDGSTDDSYARCLNYSQKDARFFICKISHSGLSDARNYGLSKATGDYIGFLDIDDWIDERFSELLVKCLQQGADIASCLSVSTKEEMESIPHSNSDSALAQMFMPEEYLALEYHEPEVNVRMGNRLYKRGLFNDLQFPSGRLYEDVTTNYMLCRQCQMIAHLPQPLHYYYIGNQSITRSELCPQDFDLPYQWSQVLLMVQDDFPELIPLIDAMRVTALRALAEKYLRFGGDPETARKLRSEFRRSFFKVLVSKEISHNKKIRSLAAAVSLPLYGEVTKFIRKDS